MYVTQQRQACAGMRARAFQAQRRIVPRLQRQAARGSASKITFRNLYILDTAMPRVFPINNVVRRSIIIQRCVRNGRFARSSGAVRLACKSRTHQR